MNLQGPTGRHGYRLTISPYGSFIPHPQLLFQKSSNPHKNPENVLGKNWSFFYLQPKSSWEYDATGYMIQPTSLPAPNCNEPPFLGPGESLMVIFQLECLQVSLFSKCVDICHDISCIIQNSKRNQIALKTYNNNNNNNNNNDHKQ